MPQLIPFYFLNQITFVFFILSFMIYIFSKYILPSFMSLLLTRVAITKF